jgi:signal transduction histidine kinase/CheY-like chemotaxis protein
MHPAAPLPGDDVLALVAALGLVLWLVAWAAARSRVPAWAAWAFGVAGAAGLFVLAGPLQRGLGATAAIGVLGLLACGLVLLALQRRALRRLAARQAALQARLDQQAAELREALADTRAARDEAEAADLAKTRFLAAASHDLRQPLHALGLYMATLRGGPLAAAQAEVAERMAAAHAALDGMFAALLDVSRLDAGAVMPRWEIVPLAPLVRRLADEWAAEADARGLRLAVFVADDDAASVSDPLLLERVLRNLIANAFKYTRSGGVLLACRTRTDAEGRRHHRIEVWDSGVGIAQADHERVFEEFFQLGNPGRDRREGLGLGLAIVRRLARVLGLEVALLSRAGRGSVFRVEGLVPAGAAPRAAAQSRAALSRLQGRVVAVIEDDAEVRDAMQRLLSMWGCEARVAADADALLALGGAPAHAVVADRRLHEGRDGHAEARRLFRAWGRELPLLLVSGDAAAVGAARADGVACLAKPVPPSRLRAWLEQALRDGTVAPDVPDAADPADATIGPR